MHKHPLDIIAEKWYEEDTIFFKDLPISEDFLEIDLVSPKKTCDQIKDWKSVGTLEIEEKMKSFDFSKSISFEIPDEPEINKFENLLTDYDVPKELPPLGYFELYKSAKLTDFITGSFLSQYGLIVSDKAKRVFELFNCGKKQFYALTLEHKETKYSNYIFFRTDSNGEDYIDYKKSEFYIQKELDFDTRQDFEFNSLKEIEIFQKENRFLYHFPGQGAKWYHGSRPCRWRWEESHTWLRSFAVNRRVQRSKASE